jgi:hypothetical protein
VTEFAHQRSGSFTHCSLINMPLRLPSLHRFCYLLSFSRTFFLLLYLSLIISSTFVYGSPFFPFILSRFVSTFFTFFFTFLLFPPPLAPRFLCFSLAFITYSPCLPFLLFVSFCLPFFLSFFYHSLSSISLYSQLRSL